MEVTLHTQYGDLIPWQVSHKARHRDSAPPLSAATAVLPCCYDQPLLPALRCAALLPCFADLPATTCFMVTAGFNHESFISCSHPCSILTLTLTLLCIPQFPSLLRCCSYGAVPVPASACYHPLWLSSPLLSSPLLSSPFHAEIQSGHRSTYATIIIIIQPRMDSLHLPSPLFCRAVLCCAYI